MKKCNNPDCGHVIPDESVFCLYCGTKWEPLKQRCPRCDFDDIPDNALFCPNCGLKLDENRQLNSKDDAGTGPNGDGKNLPPVIQHLVDNMVFVQGGSFTMGATKAHDSDASSDEAPEHQVTLSNFYIGKYEVTQEEWKAVMGCNPSSIKGAKHPVENVNWEDCQEFIRNLNSLTGKQFRLPTEAEWEFAARGGNKSKHYKYAGGNTLSSVAWYDGNSGSTIHPLGQKSPNELGLYDMSGNVYEWCQDWYDDYSSSAQTNPKGPASASYRVIRGGSWYYGARSCRVAYRNYYAPGGRSFDLGLRLAL